MRTCDRPRAPCTLSVPVLQLVSTQKRLHFVEATFLCPFADNATQIAQLLEATAALATVAQNGSFDGSVKVDITGPRHDKAVIQSVINAVHTASIPSEVLASAFATAIDNGITQGLQLPGGPGGTVPEYTAILIAAADCLGQGSAITDGLSQVCCAAQTSWSH